MGYREMGGGSCIVALEWMILLECASFLALIQPLFHSRDCRCAATRDELACAHLSEPNQQIIYRQIL
jgi:hypothetical protein